jgi:hypothetical protein
MKRPSAINTRTQKDTTYLPGTLLDSNQPFLDDLNSPYQSNTNGHLSDSDGLSESSRRIRKKRNTYQKISDDIRVLLLEAVQNGETLKAAAKRHKINYSSAKSILHTYRKEGRILKKSAQERTTKKKSDIFEEPDTPQKPVKASKKENVQPALSASKMVQPIALSAEKSKQPQNNGFNTESTPLACIQGLNDNSSTLKTMKHEYHHEDGKFNAEGQTSLFHPYHHKEDEHKDSKEHHEVNYMGALEGAHNKTKFFDNFHMNYFDAHLPEHGVDHHQQQHHYHAGEGPEYTNYMFTHTDPFTEMMNSIHGKHFQMDDHHNTNALLYPKGFNVTNPLEDKAGKGEHAMNYEDGGDNCPLRNFMDSQNLFRTALRKASFFSYGGNSTGYRKDSMDLF